MKISRKIYENKNIEFKWFFLVISSYFFTWIFVLFCSWKLFEKSMKTKILYLSDFLSNFQLFCYLNFLFLYIHYSFLKLYSSKIITFKSFFLGILSYFVTWIFSSYIFTKIFWKIYENKNILFMWFFFY